MTTLKNTSPPQSPEPRVHNVDAQSLKQWLAADEAVLIDVRERDEHAREHIPEAVFSPLSTFDPEQLPAQLPGGDGKKIVLHCRSGRRSLEAATKLAQSRRCDVYSLEGGIDAWRRSGLPVHVNRKAPIPIMRQVQIAAGSLILLGTILGVLISQWWLLLSGFVGAGLVFAGVTGTCGMATLLGKLPFNRLHSEPACSRKE